MTTRRRGIEVRESRNRGRRVVLGAAMLAASSWLPAPRVIAGSAPEVDWTAEFPAYEGTPAPRPLQALEVIWSVDFADLPVPDGFSLTAAEYAPDFEHFRLDVEDSKGANHAAVMLPDGSDFQCLTCDVVPVANKVDFLDDGQRVWFSDNVGQNQAPGGLPVPTVGGTGDFQWRMLHCAPSVYDCTTRQVYDVDFPIDSLTTLPVGAQNREASPDPSGSFVAWNEVRTTDGTRVTTAALVFRDDRYVLENPRVIQPPFTPGSSPRDWVVGGRFYEGGRWLAGSRFVKYQTTRSALNYDTGLFDLATGEYRFQTRDLDYNETGSLSPDGRWMDYSSARGLDRMDVFTQLVRPPFLDMVTFGQVGRVSLWNNRRCMNEAWLMDSGGQRPDGYGGQPLVTEDQWLARQRQWVPGTNTMLVQEQLLPNVAAGIEPGRQYRIRLVRFPAMDVAPPVEPVDLHEVDWDRISVPSSSYQGMAARPAALQRVRGRAGGTATMTFAGTFSAGTWTVIFDRYSDDGQSFVSGTERLIAPNPILATVYDVDLVTTGARTGSMRGRVVTGPQNVFSGQMDTTINGQTWSGIPTQATCPGVWRAPLVLDVDPPGWAGGRGQVRVLARIPEDPLQRPVAGAAVLVDGVQVATTDDNGVAWLDALPPGSVVGATAGGFRAAEPAECCTRGPEARPR